MNIKLYILSWELWKKYGWGRAYQAALRGRPENYKGRSTLTYGETPRAVMEKIKIWSQIAPDQLFLELGSGTGLFSLWLALSTQCKSIGVELVSEFVQNSNAIAKKLSLSAQFVELDIFEYSWSEADLIYLTATCFSDDQIVKIAHKCKEIKKGAKFVILTHQIKVEQLELCEMWVEEFSWGVSTIFLYTKTQ